MPLFSARLPTNAPVAEAPAPVADSAMRRGLASAARSRRKAAAWSKDRVGSRTRQARVGDAGPANQVGLGPARIGTDHGEIGARLDPAMGAASGDHDRVALLQVVDGLSLIHI